MVLSDLEKYLVKVMVCMWVCELLEDVNDLFEKYRNSRRDGVFVFL